MAANVYLYKWAPEGKRATDSTNLGIVVTDLEQNQEEVQSPLLRFRDDWENISRTVWRENKEHYKLIVTRLMAEIHVWQNNPDVLRTNYMEMTVNSYGNSILLNYWERILENDERPMDELLERCVAEYLA